MDAASVTTRIIERISTALDQLEADGLTRAGVEILRERMSFLWTDNGPGHTNTTTKWRRTRARRNYGELQKLSEELLLGTLLAITPTQCARTSFDSVLDHYDRHQDYNRNLRLRSGDKAKLESIAAEKGFANHLDYQKFMKGLFPIKDSRQIQLAYSDIPLENIDTLFTIMRKGIETSRQWAGERSRGDRTSAVVTALVPTGDKDGCFTINIGREDMMRSLRQLGLSQFKL